MTDKAKNQKQTEETRHQANTDTPNDSDTTQKEDVVKNIEEKLTQAADKGMEIAKGVFQRVRQFSTEATELARLKLELRNLKMDREQLFRDMGKKLWRLNTENKFRGIKSAFSREFERLEKLDKKIAVKEDEAKKISLT